MRRSFPFLLLALAIAAGPARGGTADGLMRLVPPDAGVTLAIENLRTQVRAVAGSPLPEKIRRLAAVQALLGSEKARQLERAARDIEASLGVPIAAIRDEILGDAVVLTLLPGPANAPDQSRGLLLVQPRDQASLVRMVAALNSAQGRSGELQGVEPRERGGSTYRARKYKAAGRPPDFYAHLGDGTFAWSNSEALIQGVMDRKAERRPCLKDNLAFLKVRRELPEDVLASLYINPKLIEQAIDLSPRPADPGGERASAMLGRFVGAVGYSGLALEWRDGPVLHMVEAIDPARLDPWIKAWLTDPAPAANPELLARVPDSALALVAGHVDFEALRDAFWELTPEDDRPALENWKLGFQGLLLGEDPNVDVLPRLGPGTLAYLDSVPEANWMPPFPIVGVVGWSDRPGPGDLGAAIDNALRTGLAGYALLPNNKAKHLRVAPRKVGEVSLTTLTDGLRTPFAYGVSRDRIVFGNGPEAVARYGSGRPASPLLAIRARFFPDAATFAVVDFVGLAREIRRYRGPIAASLAARSGRPVIEADRDLVQVLALIDLFRAASLSAAVEKDASSIRRTARLIPR